MTNRDEFSSKTKSVVALRASYCCSFRNCGKSTVGPSDESSMAVAVIGEAAHISAAAPGGKRYLASMSPEERVNIDNAIWLCSDHATLIDRDEVTYTREVLHMMKRDHEASCKSAVTNGLSHLGLLGDLLAIGPNIICVGDIFRIESGAWSFHLKHFVVGDLGTLISFIDAFDKLKPINRYVLVNEVGDGRILTTAPSVTKNETGYIVQCPVSSSFPRVTVQSLPVDLVLSKDHDLEFKNGDLAFVSGLEALPQKIQMSLSLQKGESPFHLDYGSRFAEYYGEFLTTPWIGRLLKLEVIRQSAIPYTDPALNRQYTPFQCIERVWGIEVLSDVPNNQWLPIRVDLGVKGLGRRQYNVSVFVPVGKTIVDGRI